MFDRTPKIGKLQLKYDRFRLLFDVWPIAIEVAYPAYLKAQKLSY